MKEKYKYIEILLDRFFEGSTSNGEEQELYSFFESDDVPVHLQEYKPIFEYFAKGIIEEYSGEESIIVLPQSKKIPAKKIVYGFVAAAACILILLTFNPFNKKTFNPYEGSYIVENGVKVYDVDKIIEEENNIDLIIDNKEKELEQLMNPVKAEVRL